MSDEVDRQYIEVTDRPEDLPHVGQLVLVLGTRLAYEHLGEQEWVCVFKGKTGWEEDKDEWWLPDQARIFATHWMPLPPRPRPAKIPPKPSYVPDGAIMPFRMRRFGERFRYSPSGCTYQKTSQTEGWRFWMGDEEPISIDGDTWTWDPPTEDERD